MTKGKKKKARIVYQESENLKCLESTTKTYRNEHTEASEVIQRFALSDNLVVEVKVKNGCIEYARIEPRTNVWVASMNFTYDNKL